MATARPLASPPWAHAATETILFASVLPALLLWLAPGRTLTYVIPALVLIPLVCGLRGGFVLGSFSALLVTAIVAGTNYLRPELLEDYPKFQMVCLFLAGAAAGKASDYWNAELRRMANFCGHYKSRMNSFMAAYQMLQASHAQLERRVAGNQQSLRTSMQRLSLHRHDVLAGAVVPLDGMGHAILEVMAETAGLYVAAIHEIGERGVPRLEPLAKLGNLGELSAFHPLLREALRTGTVAFVLPAAAGPENDFGSPALVAVVPLVDASGHVHAVVAVQDMHFLSMRAETFTLMGLLGRHIGNLLTRRAKSADEDAGPYSFSQYLHEQLACSILYGAPSMLIALRAPDSARSAALIRHCTADGRDLDQNWIMTNRAQQPVILKLLPMTDEAGAEEYIKRMKRVHLPVDHGTDNLVVQTWPLHQAVNTRYLLSELHDAFGLAAADPTPIRSNPTLKRATI